MKNFLFMIALAVISAFFLSGSAHAEAGLEINVKGAGEMLVYNEHPSLCVFALPRDGWKAMSVIYPMSSGTAHFKRTRKGFGPGAVMRTTFPLRVGACPTLAPGLSASAVELEMESQLSKVSNLPSARIETCYRGYPREVTHRWDSKVGNWVSDQSFYGSTRHCPLGYVVRFVKDDRSGEWVVKVTNDDVRDLHRRPARRPYRKPCVNKYQPGCSSFRGG